MPLNNIFFASSQSSINELMTQKCYFLLLLLLFSLFQREIRLISCKQPSVRSALHPSYLYCFMLTFITLRDDY